jgi:glycerophosphoryl diester phosphodiesterase
MSNKIKQLIVVITAVGGLLSACSDSEATSDTTTTIFKPEATTVADTLALGRPVVLAHASGENIHPHSTPFGFADSVANGVDILDFDVQLSKDGVLVVQHDDSVDRTTNTTGKIADLTYDELFKLDNAYWFTMNCTCADQPEADYIYRGIRTGEKEPPAGYTADDFIIPKFEDLVKKYPNHLLNIEIKGEYPAAVPAAKELARILTDTNSLDRAVVTSFDDQIVDEFRKLAPTVELTPGLDATSAWVLQRKPLENGMRILQVPPEYQGIEVLTQKLVDDSHAAGYVLWIWPNERKWETASGYQDLLAFGVDGINAADPITAVSVVGNYKSE